SPRFNVNLFISQASDSQILETIITSFPHFNFTKAAKVDCDLVCKTFCEMEVHHLSGVLFLPSREPQHYFHAKLGFPMFSLLDSQATVTLDSNINSGCLNTFNNLIFSYLRTGEYQIAGDNLNNFINIYKHLNEDKIYEIKSCDDQASESLSEHLGCLQRTHAYVKGNILLLSDPRIFPSTHWDMQSRLETATLQLQSCKKTFEGAV
ncbi:hypothetical protein DFH28DRAFT_891168, partial [Melampsora americana]